MLKIAQNAFKTTKKSLRKRAYGALISAACPSPEADLSKLKQPRAEVSKCRRQRPRELDLGILAVNYNRSSDGPCGDIDSCLALYGALPLFKKNAKKANASAYIHSLCGCDRLY